MVTRAETMTQSIRDDISSGNLIMAFDQLNLAIDRGTDDPDMRYLYVLVLARMGMVARAMAAHERLRISEIATTEAQALFARLLKDVAFAETGAGRRMALVRAADAYRRVHDETGDLYPAINAASLYFLADEKDAARDLAQRIIAASVDIAAPGYYDFATLAEAFVVRGDHNSAADALRRASTSADDGVSERAGTYRQLSRLMDHAGTGATERAQLLQAVSPGMAVFFCGRMFEEDPKTEARLQNQIDKFISDHDIVACFGSLACGADILVAERMQRHGIAVFVTLAADADSFVDVSVRQGGPGWVARFHACLAAAEEVHVASDSFHSCDPLAFALTADLAMGAAARFAQQNMCALHQLAILDSGEAQGTIAGTSADVERWQAMGRAATVIRADGIKRPKNSSAGPTSPVPFERRALSLLFADFVGFSDICDGDLPNMVHRSLAMLANVLDRYGDRVLLQNTWGDACFIVCTDPVAAAEVALTLVEKLSKSDMGHVTGGLRISLHHGIVMEIFDPVLGRKNYFGHEVSRAARIEPVTPPKCVYASQQFAAVAANATSKHLKFDYAGRVPLPKGFGDERLYLLSGIEERE